MARLSKIPAYKRTGMIPETMCQQLMRVQAIIENTLKG